MRPRRTFFCHFDTLKSQKGNILNFTIDYSAAMCNNIKEVLIKSRHASCLLIFRLIARKLLEIHQVFLRHFHTILGAASA